jgi:hypothetical protein
LKAQKSELARFRGQVCIKETGIHRAEHTSDIYKCRKLYNSIFRGSIVVFRREHLYQAAIAHRSKL